MSEYVTYVCMYYLLCYKETMEAHPLQVQGIHTSLNDNKNNIYYSMVHMRISTSM